MPFAGVQTSCTIVSFWTLIGRCVNTLLLFLVHSHLAFRVFSFLLEYTESSTMDPLGLHDFQ